jgi:DNA-binding NtrC family response regulator
MIQSEHTTIGESEQRPISLDARLQELEANLIHWALSVSRGNKSRAARLLQIKRSTLGDRINRLKRASKQPAPEVHAVET